MPEADRIIGYGPSSTLGGQFATESPGQLLRIIHVGGYDEKMAGYGFEDYDITNRLEMVGLTRLLIYGDEFLKFVPHDTEERYSLKGFRKSITACYINYINPWESSVLMLFQDRTFKLATIVNYIAKNADNPNSAFTGTPFLFELGLKDNRWQNGILSRF